MPLGANDGAATLGTVWPLLCAAAIILALLAAGCGRQAGEPCVFQGSGFTASDPCATRCLSHWRIRCPDGSTVSPQQCAGRSGCMPGDCPDGQACYHFEDTFEARSYCVPDRVCGAQTASARHAWEQAALQRAEALRARRQERLRRREATLPTRPAAVVDIP